MTPMPVPAVLVALKGAKGCMIIDDASGKEVRYIQIGGRFAAELSSPSRAELHREALRLKKQLQQPLRSLLFP